MNPERFLALAQEYADLGDSVASQARVVAGGPGGIDDLNPNALDLIADFFDSISAEVDGAEEASIEAEEAARRIRGGAVA